MKDRLKVFEYNDETLVAALNNYAKIVQYGERALVCRKAADRIDFMVTGLQKLQKKLLTQIPVTSDEDILHLVEDILEGDHV